MLNIIFGRENVPKELVPKVILDSRVYFQLKKKPEWFEDPFVREFLKVVDNTTVLFEEALKDYKGRGISPLMISTGCKTLCCIYFNTTGQIFYGSAMGNNCLPFLVRIAQKKDITIFLEHYADFPRESFSQVDICCNGVILNQDTYDDAYGDWSASTCEEGFLEKFNNCGL